MEELKKYEAVCEDFCVHDEVVADVRAHLIDADRAYELAEFFKIFGDVSRLRIIEALSIREMCVCDIAQLLTLSQSATSHQLKLLRQGKIVKPRKEGKMVYYTLCDDHVRHIFDEGAKHVLE